LGFTLDGSYQVKSEVKSIESANSIHGINNDTKLDTTVFGAFKKSRENSNPSLVEKWIISHSETSNKYGSKMIFPATRQIDLKASIGQSNFTFEKVLPNSEDSFNAKTGTLTIPQSGVYL